MAKKSTFSLKGDQTGDDKSRALLLFVSAVGGNWPLYFLPSSHAARLLSSLKGRPHAQSFFRLLPYVCKAQS